MSLAARRTRSQCAVCLSGRVTPSSSRAEVNKSREFLTSLGDCPARIPREGVSTPAWSSSHASCGNDSDASSSRASLQAASSIRSCAGPAGGEIFSASSWLGSLRIDEPTCSGASPMLESYGCSGSASRVHPVDVLRVSPPAANVTKVLSAQRSRARERLKWRPTPGGNTSGFGASSRSRQCPWLCWLLG